jgi:hypothetical protein
VERKNMKQHHSHFKSLSVAKTYVDIRRCHCLASGHCHSCHYSHYSHHIARSAEKTKTNLLTRWTGQLLWLAKTSWQASQLRYVFSLRVGSELRDCAQSSRCRLGLCCGGPARTQPAPSPTVKVESGSKTRGQGSDASLRLRV